MTHSAAARYVVVGGFGYAVNLVVFAVAVRLVGLDEYVALAPAFVLNTLSNFLLNRWWTFGSRAPLGAELGRFTAVAALLLVTNYTTFHVFFSVLGLPDIAAQALAIVVGLPIGFTINRLWTFAPEVDPTRDVRRD